jgi:hypothetical protein
VGIPSVSRRAVNRTVNGYGRTFHGGIRFRAVPFYSRICMHEDTRRYGTVTNTAVIRFVTAYGTTSHVLYNIRKEIGPGLMHALL